MSMQIKPIFIIGSPRSGTTLLRLLLNSHSNIFVPPEAGFALWLYKKYRNFTYEDLDAYISDMKLTKKIDNWCIDWSRLEQYLKRAQPRYYATLIDSIYCFYGESIGRTTTLWGDKNNFYLNYIENIKNLFSDARFIHIVRDGRNVACSYKNLNRKKIESSDAPKLPNNISDIANEWKTNLDIINDSFKLFDYKGVLEVRLEDLTLNPIFELEKIMDFIGETFEKDMLQYYKSETGKEPSEYLQWKHKNTKPIENEPWDKFKTELSKTDINAFNSIAAELLSMYNYELEESEIKENGVC